MSDLKQAVDFGASQVEMRKALDFASYKAEMDKYAFPSEIQGALNTAFEVGYISGVKAAIDGFGETLKNLGAFDDE